VTDTDRPKIEELQVGVAFWKAYREARRAKGFDVAKFYTDLAEEQKQKLTSPGAQEDFTELCEDGCFQLVLAAIVAILRYSPQLEGFWTETVGHPDNREKATRALENAAQTPENLFSRSWLQKMKGRTWNSRKSDGFPFHRWSPSFAYIFGSSILLTQ